MAFPAEAPASPTPPSPAPHHTPGITVEVVGLSPAVATANLMLVTSQALGIAALANARAQEASLLEAQAVTTRCVALLLGREPAPAPSATTGTVFR